MFRQLLSAEFQAYARLSDSQLEKLAAHYETLTRWNERLNLTRIRDLTDSIRFHYCESLFMARSLPPGAHRIVDIGSGGGFPGIPVAIFRPDCEVTLVESHQRKAVFLREAARGLPNVRVISGRAEEVQERFDWLISRAVAPADILQLSLAENAALLIGEEDASKLLGDFVPLPWGSNRVLFHVERKVSGNP
jgi:16S rRNA (guanine(527)-N(7))-methyltransferase RsmG